MTVLAGMVQTVMTGGIAQNQSMALSAKNLVKLLTLAITISVCVATKRLLTEYR